MITPLSFRERYRRHRVADANQADKGKYLSEMMYGANDGIITTFAVVSGAVGASLSSGIILILGLASLIADGFSMASSNYLSLSSERKFNKVQRQKETEEVENVPDIEREEVREILMKKWKFPPEQAESITQFITADKDRWVEFMMREELDIIEDDGENLSKNSLVTFFSFVIAGALPLAPYLFSIPLAWQFFTSIIATAIALFFVGAVRATLLRDDAWWLLGLEMLLIGGISAVIAYGIGYLIHTVLGIAI